MSAYREAMRIKAEAEKRKERQAAMEQQSPPPETPRCRHLEHEDGGRPACTCAEPCLAVRMLAAADRPSVEPPVDRRHELGRRWVKASVRLLRAEHPDWDTFAVTKQAGLGGGRPWHFTERWRKLGGDSHRDLTPEQLEQLSDLLDREERELEQLEARAQELESAARR